MKPLAALPFGLATILAVVSCSSSSGGIHFRCDRAHLPFHICSEYDDLDAAGLAGQQSNCMRPGETAVSQCPTGAALGTCALPNGSLVSAFLVYSDVGDETAAQAETFCTQSGGMWSPG